MRCGYFFQFEWILLKLPFQCSLLGGKIGAATREQMDKLTDQYNARLVKIVKEYQAANYPDL